MLLSSSVMIASACSLYFCSICLDALVYAFPNGKVFVVQMACPFLDCFLKSSADNSWETPADAVLRFLSYRVLSQTYCHFGRPPARRSALPLLLGTGLRPLEALKRLLSPGRLPWQILSASLTVCPFRLLAAVHSGLCAVLILRGAPSCRPSSLGLFSWPIHFCLGTPATAIPSESPVRSLQPPSVSCCLRFRPRLLGPSHQLGLFLLLVSARLVFLLP